MTFVSFNNNEEDLTTTYLPSPEDPTLHLFPNLDLYLKILPHLVLVILREGGIVPRITCAGAEDMLVRGITPLPCPASANATAVEPFCAVSQCIGPFSDHCPDVRSFKVHERLGQVACIGDMLIEGTGKLVVTEDLVHVLWGFTISNRYESGEYRLHTMSIDVPRY